MQTAKKVAVYTAVFGAYDNLQLPLYAEKLRHEADFYCFTDNASLSSDYFKIVNRIPFEGDYRKSARYLKIKGDTLLNEYQYIIWCDGCVKVITDSLQRLIDNILIENSLAVFTHYARTCLYEEGIACAERQLDSLKKIHTQLVKYKHEGYPEDYGLLESGVFLRKNNTETENFMEMWWNEINKGSIRDQLSFDFVRWKSSTSVTYLEGTLRDNAYFKLYTHSKAIPSLLPSPSLLEKVYNKFYKSYQQYLYNYYLAKIKSLKQQ